MPVVAFMLLMAVGSVSSYAGNETTVRFYDPQGINITDVQEGSVIYSRIKWGNLTRSSEETAPELPVEIITFLSFPCRKIGHRLFEILWRDDIIARIHRRLFNIGSPFRFVISCIRIYDKFIDIYLDWAVRMEYRQTCESRSIAFIVIKAYLDFTCH